MKKQLLIILLIVIFCGNAYSKIIYLKCDISNIQVSERIEKKDLDLFKKLQYLSFNDISVTKMKTLEGNDAFIFF